MPLYNWDTVQYLEWTGDAGTNDNDIIYQSPNINDYNYHIIDVHLGTVDVDVSSDGENYVQGVGCVDVTSTTPGTRVVDAASGTMLQLDGKFKAIRVRQKGATASNARGAHAKKE